MIRRKQNIMNAQRTRRYESLDTLEQDMSSELVSDLLSVWDKSNFEAQRVCLKHQREIQGLLRVYGDDMYGDSSLSIMDFRGGFNSMARDILLCADILTEDDIFRSRGVGRESKGLRRGRMYRERRYGISRKNRRFESSAIVSQEHAQRAADLKDLKGQELFDALQPGDILDGRWGYNRTITEYFIVKRKTAKRLVIHKLLQKNGNQPGDSVGGWTVCPVLPVKEDPNERDIQCMVMDNYVKNPDYPKYLYIWSGTYGWENDD